MDKNSENSDLKHLELGKFYFLNQKYDEAIREFEQAIKEASGKSEAYYNLGLVYETRGQFDQAREAFHHALEIDPGHKPSEEHLAKLVGG